MWQNLVPIYVTFGKIFRLIYETLGKIILPIYDTLGKIYVPNFDTLGKICVPTFDTLGKIFFPTYDTFGKGLVLECGKTKIPNLDAAGGSGNKDIITLEVTMNDRRCTGVKKNQTLQTKY